jgi:predicted pyridoxine 5'-phosphate oxidase superfamily flavin-nucleotide-binding protein
VVSIDPELLASFEVDGKAPRSVLVVTVEAVFFQCARAILRSDLWNPDRHVPLKNLPSAGQMLAALSRNRIGCDQYDRDLPERVRRTLY